MTEYEAVGCYVCNHIFLVYFLYDHHRKHCKGSHFDRLYTFARRRRERGLTHDEYFEANFKDDLDAEESMV